MAISTLLIANRGEIAVRIIRTCQRIGVRAVAVYSDADRDALHVRLADEAIRIGAAPPRDSYLNLHAIIEAARRSGADAIHPGYGFLSEKPDLAEAAAATGLIFVGPSPRVLREMGSKIGAKAIAAANGVPSVPGYSGEDQGDARLIAEAQAIGFPLMVKASAGGGGKGMRAVADREALPPAIELARREAESAFGDATLLLEKLVARPRHIEVQIAGDRHGNLVHLWERDCSVQRHHQKLLEEAPAPNLPAAVRDKLLTRAVTLGRAMDYDNLGTVEFILEQGNDEPWFLEVNARLQVEHPVTEAITGLDLVEWQLRIAAGEALPLQQDQIGCSGHAIEARVTAERADADFRPDLGRLLLVDEPTAVRVDSGIATGSEIGPYYDSLLSKVIAGGTDREQARERLEAALRSYVILGPATTLPFLADAVAHPIFRNGEATTAFIGEAFPDGWSEPPAPPIALAIAAVLRAAAAAGPAGDTPWNRLRGFRTLGPSGALSKANLLLDTGTAREPVLVEAPIDGRWRIAHGEDRWILRATVQGDRIDIDQDARQLAARGVVAGDHVQLWIDGHRSVFELSLQIESGSARQGAAADDGQIRSPMPGVVSEIRVTVGEAVTAGETVAVIESMKLFMPIAATIDGTVTSVESKPGDAVTAHQRLLTIGPADAGEGARPREEAHSQ
jgi:3-methylcrotonyl-CoA carboxylase alpha subunit